jgi:hypothetical protein
MKMRVVQEMVVWGRVSVSVCVCVCVSRIDSPLKDNFRCVCVPKRFESAAAAAAAAAAATAAAASTAAVAARHRSHM